jgi:hypothetical protein
MKKRTKIIALIFVILVVISSFSVNIISKGNQLIKKEKISMNFMQKLLELKTQKNLVEITKFSTYKLNISFPETPDNIIIYKTKDPDYSISEVEKLKNAFELQGQVTSFDGKFIINDNNKVLVVNNVPGTGYIHFRNYEEINKDEAADNLPSEDDAIKMAENFLKNNGLYENNNYYSHTGYYEFKEWNKDGIILRAGKSALAVIFGFEINGYKVIGPGAKSSVIFGENGKIIGAHKFWREIEYDKQTVIISASDALDLFKENWPEEGTSEQLEEADYIFEIIIEEVYLAYYAEVASSPQNTIEPVYVFTGYYRSYSPAEQEYLDDCCGCNEKFIKIVPAVSN